MPPFESMPSNQPEDASKKAANAMLAAAEKMRRDAPTVPEKSAIQTKPGIGESPFGQPYVAPIEIKPGEKSSPGAMPEELKNIGEEDIEGAFGNMQAGEMERETAERPEGEALRERKIARQNTEYANILAQNEKLRQAVADEDAAMLKLYRKRLGLEVNTPIPKGQKFAFTPYEQRKFREMQEAAQVQQEQQPPSQAA